MQHLQSNTTLQGGKYRIERVLGQGGLRFLLIVKLRLKNCLLVVVVRLSMSVGVIWLL